MAANERRFVLLWGCKHWYTVDDFIPLHECKALINPGAINYRKDRMKERKKDGWKEGEKFLYPNKPFCQHNNPYKTKSNRFRKSPDLIDTMIQDSFPVPQRGDRKGRPENHVFVFWGQ